MEKQLFARTSSGLTRDISAKDALIFNILVMCPGTAYIYGIWAAAFYPGVNLPVAALMAIPVVLVIGVFYALYSSSLPRTGGDYVWTSRVLHPAVGFSIVFFVMFALMSFTGTINVWMIDYSVGPILTYFGYTAASSFLSSNTGLLIVGILVILLFSAIVASGTKNFIKVLWISSIVQIIGVITYLAVLLYVGPEGFKASFNALSGMNYDTAISAAQTAGYPSGFTAGGTFLGIVYIMLSFTGFNLSVYISGEIKEVRRSQLIAIVGGTIFFGLWLFIVFAVTYMVMGAQFVNSMSYLSIMGNSAYTLPFTPTFYNLLFVYAAKNNVPLIAIVNAGFLISLCSNLTYIFTCVRMVFAWSFDRILPKSFATMDKRYNSPYVALLVVMVIALFSLGLWLYTPVMSYYAYMTPGWFLQIAIVAFSGIIFPFRRKDIFDRSPPLAAKKIGGVPLLSILGLASLILCTWIIYAGFMPSFAGTINPTYVAFTFSIFIIGLAIYVISSIYRRKTGLPLEMTFKEVPPE